MDERPTPTVFGALSAFRWTSALIVLVAVATSVAFGLATRPEITATAKMVLATPTSNDQTVVAAATEPTFVRYVAQRALFATSNQVLKSAATKLNDISVQSLQDHVTAMSGPSGGAVLVTGSASSAARAATIANAVVDAYTSESTKQILARSNTTLAAIRRAEAVIVAQVGLKQAVANPSYQALVDQESTITVSTARFGSGVTFVDPATSASAVRPSLPYLDGAVGLAIGFLLAAAIAWVRDDRRRNRVRPDEEIASIIGAPSLATIGRSKSLRRSTRFDAASLPARPFQLAWVTAQSRAGRGVVLLTGPEPSEGRTTAAVHLAASAARDGYRVLLVDGDQHTASLTARFGLDDGSPGFDALMANPARLDDVAHRVDLGNGAMLSVMSAGKSTSLPPGAHRMDAVASALTSMRDSFEVVFIDSAATVDVPENAALATHADHLIVVVREDGDREALRRFIQRVSLFHSDPAGHIINFAENATVRADGAGVKSASSLA